jgi:hypothetical protein
MPIGDKVEETGLVLRDGRRIILRVDDGGEWELDLRRFRPDMLGRRMHVTGQRSGFNLIDVDRIDPA